MSKPPNPITQGLRAVMRIIGGGGFANLDRAGRTRRLRRVQRTPLGQLVRAVGGLLVISYYGDDGVCRLLGYDAGANVARGRRLIAEEGRIA